VERLPGCPLERPGGAQLRHSRRVAREVDAAVIRAGEDRVRDLADFERWLDLETTGDQTLANLHASHFQGELRTAFAAWLAQDPLNNPNAIPTPLNMPQYTQAGGRACSKTRDGR
jgi:hypothetical protein